MGIRIPSTLTGSWPDIDAGTLARTPTPSRLRPGLGPLYSCQEVFGVQPEDMVFEEQEIYGPSQRNERHAYGPTGERVGRGGYLEYNLSNRRLFVAYFNPHLSCDWSALDLMKQSSTFTRNRPLYRILPPKDLWPNMLATLSFLNVVLPKLGVTATIQSVYRSYFINRRSGGARSSQHLDFSAIDLDPISDVARLRTYLEHYYYERGNTVKLGLGLYASGRTHVDVGTRRRRATWPEGTINSRRQAEQNFRRLFGSSMTLEP